MKTDDRKISLSVIVPVYKVEKYLPQCIESLIATERNDFEVILVDDGSPDRCPEICDAYAARDSRIQVIHQKNAGVSAARNAGLAACRGGYISFVDSDDYVEKDYVETLIEGMNGVDMLLFGQTIRNINGENRRQTYGEFKTDGIDDTQSRQRQVATTTCYFNCVWSNCFRRDIIDKYSLRFDERMHLYEDSLFYYEYLLHVSHLRSIDRVVYNHKTGDMESLCHSAATSPAGKEKAYGSFYLGTRLCELAKQYGDGYIKQDLRDYAGASMLLFVIGNRGLHDILAAHRKARAFCRAEGLRMPYAGMAWPILRRMWAKLRGK